MLKLLWPVAVSLTLSFALFCPVEVVSANQPGEMKFSRDKALRITRKQGGEPLYLSVPESVRIGDRAFLTGYRLTDDVAVYVPVSDIDLIEEYASVDSVRKKFNLEKK